MDLEESKYLMGWLALALASVKLKTHVCLCFENNFYYVNLITSNRLVSGVNRILSHIKQWSVDLRISDSGSWINSPLDDSIHDARNKL